jgi:hypothetical protein
LRQSEHQIEVEVVEAGRAGRLDRPVGRLGIVDAAQGAQFVIVEALDAERQPIDPGGPVAAEPRLVGRAGVGLERDLDVAGEGQQRADPSSSRAMASALNRLGVPPPMKRLCSGRSCASGRSCSRSSSSAST